MRSLQLYLDKVRHVVDSENGKQLAALYSINQHHVRSLTEQNLQVYRARDEPPSSKDETRPLTCFIDRSDRHYLQIQNDVPVG